MTYALGACEFVYNKVSRRTKAVLAVWEANCVRILLLGVGECALTFVAGLYAHPGCCMILYDAEMR